MSKIIVAGPRILKTGYCRRMAHRVFLEEADRPPPEYLEKQKEEEEEKKRAPAHPAGQCDFSVPLALVDGPILAFRA